MRASEVGGVLECEHFDLDAAERPIALGQVLQVMAKNDLSFDEGRYQMVLTKMAEMDIDASGMPTDSKLVTFGDSQSAANVDNKTCETYSPEEPKLLSHSLDMLGRPKTWNFGAKALCLVGLVLIIVGLVATVFWKDDLISGFMCQSSSEAGAWTQWICRHVTPHVNVPDNGGDVQAPQMVPVQVAELITGSSANQGASSFEAARNS
jgi:hypothetical protein